MKNRAWTSKVLQLTLMGGLSLVGCASTDAAMQDEKGIAKEPQADATQPAKSGVETPAPVLAPETDQPKIEVKEEFWPNKQPKLRVEGYTDPDGAFIQHGPTTKWYESGQVHMKGTWVHGVPEGERTTWYFHGQMWGRGSYIAGLEDGKWEKWHQNGEKHSEWTMDRGAWNGVYTEWHPNGKKRLEVEWVAGLRQGPQYMWDEQGVLVQTSDFVNSVEQP